MYSSVINIVKWRNFNLKNGYTVESTLNSCVARLITIRCTGDIDVNATKQKCVHISVREKLRIFHNGIII